MKDSDGDGEFKFGKAQQYQSFIDFSFDQDENFLVYETMTSGSICKTKIFI